MKIITHKDMFAEQDNYTAVFVTTNAFIKRGGSLVMGRGAAVQLARLAPKIPKLFAHAIARSENPKEYGIVVVDWSTPEYYGAFQVKNAWWDEASLQLIENSCKKLAQWYNNNYYPRIAMNYPDIGNGRLQRTDVEPILQEHLQSVDVDIYIR